MMWIQVMSGAVQSMPQVGGGVLRVCSTPVAVTSVSQMVVVGGAAARSGVSTVFVSVLLGGLLGRGWLDPGMRPV